MGGARAIEVGGIIAVSLSDPRVQEWLSDPRVLGGVTGGLVLLLLIVVWIQSRREKEAEEAWEEVDGGPVARREESTGPPDWFDDFVKEIVGDGLVVQRSGSGRSDYNLKHGVDDAVMVLGVYESGELWVYGSFHESRAGERFSDYIAAANAVTAEDVSDQTWGYVREDVSRDELEAFVRTAYETLE